MKKIKVEKYNYENGLYKVYFSSDYQFTFTSLKKLNKFFSSVNKNYQQQLVFLNETLKTLYSIYRTEYFSLHRTDVTAIKKNVENIENKLHRLTGLNTSDNSNYFILIDFQIIYNELIAINYTLLDHFKKNSTTSLIYQLKMIKTLILDNRTKLYQFQSEIDFNKSETIKQHLQIVNNG